MYCRKILRRAVNPAGVFITAMLLAACNDAGNQTGQNQQTGEVSSTYVPDVKSDSSDRSSRDQTPDSLDNQAASNETSQDAVDDELSNQPVPISLPPVVKSAAGTKPNILVILADDLGYSDIGAFGSEIETPNLDELAKQGRVLTNYHTGPVCAVTRAMLISGTDHHLVGQGSMNPKDAKRKDQPGYENFLNGRALSIAQLLKDADYHTYISGKWNMGIDLAAKQGPENHGFEKSFVLLNAASTSQYIDLAIAGKSQEFAENGVHPTPESAGITGNHYSSDLYTDKLIQQIDSNKDDGKPFFAYLSFTAPHDVNEVPQAYVDKYKGLYKEGGASLRQSRIAKQIKNGIISKDFAPSTQTPPADVVSYQEIYAGMIDNLDHNVGRLIEHLKAIKKYDNTFIVFHSDNGGTIRTPFANTPLRSFKTDLYEGGTSSPTIVVLPGQTANVLSGQTDKLSTLHDFAHVTDLAPTLLELAGIKPPQEPAKAGVLHVDERRLAKVLYDGREVYPMTGTSLLSWLEGQKTGSVHISPVFGEYNSKASARTAKWKANWDRNGAWELYDLEKDRGETTDLSAKNHERLKELVQGWEDYVQRVGVIKYGNQWPTNASDLGPKPAPQP